MRSRVFFKLLAAFVLVIAVATVLLDFAVRSGWESSLRAEIQRSMAQKTRLFAARIASDHSRPLAQIVAEESAAAEARATVIDSSGRVLADSEANPDQMENHAARPEFQAALAGRTGSASRTSATVGMEFLYAAAPVPGGAVRLAYPLSSIRQSTAQIRRTLLLSSLIALVVATLLAAWIAQLTSRRLRRIVVFAERIAAGDLSARIAEPANDEIAHVAASLDATAQQLEQSFAALATSREELEILLNSMQEAVIAVGRDRRVRWTNGRMELLARGGVRLGAPLIETVRDPSFLAAIEGALDRSEIATTRATSLVAGRTYQVTAAPMPPGGAVAVLHDLTELERVEKTRRDFIANVSHELRTPLTSVQGYAETLMDTLAAQNPPAQEFLQIILKNATRMARLTEDLLVLARVESGEQRFSMASVTAASLLEEAATSFHRLAYDRGLELAVVDTPTQSVLADPAAIHQVFANLIDNAIKYGGGSIELGSHPVLGTGTLEFYVRDLGPGIASEHLPRLFERFYRVDKARSRESGGTGLGLAIVKHIIRAHGGEVRAESELGHGSTFYFTLPLARAAPLAAAVNSEVARS